MPTKCSLLLMCVCAFSTIHCSTVSKDYEYMESAQYKSRGVLRQALANGSESLSEGAIQKILASRVSLPKQITIAIVRLSDTKEGLDFQTIDKEISDKFYDKSNWGARIQSVIPVPQMMLATPVTLPALRQTAALMQADVLLIIKPISYGDWKFEWIEANKGKGVTSLEILLLDTRTSVVPYTAVITEAAEISKDSSEYSNYELMSRAKKASEAKALLQVAPAIQKFISKTM